MYKGCTCTLLTLKSSISIQISIVCKALLWLAHLCSGLCSGKVGLVPLKESPSVRSRFINEVETTGLFEDIVQGSGVQSGSV